LYYYTFPLSLRCVPHRHLPSFPTRRSSDLLNYPSSQHGKSRPTGTAQTKTSKGVLYALLVLQPLPQFPGGEMREARALHGHAHADRKSTRLNSSHVSISYAVFCLKKKNNNQ